MVASCDLAILGGVRTLLLRMAEVLNPQMQTLA